MTPTEWFPFPRKKISQHETDSRKTQAAASGLLLRPLLQGSRAGLGIHLAALQS